MEARKEVRKDNDVFMGSIKEGQGFNNIQFAVVVLIS